MPTINHSGTMQAGHCWVHIKDEYNRGWLKSNGTSVIATPFSVLSNTSSYEWAGITNQQTDMIIST